MHSFSSFWRVTHDITILFTYFASFTDYENEIFEVISNLHVQGSKFGGEINKFGKNSNKKSWTPRSLWSLFFSRPALELAGREGASKFCLQMELEHASQSFCIGDNYPWVTCGPWQYERKCDTFWKPRTCL